jgi:hypothetical protein
VLFSEDEYKKIFSEWIVAFAQGEYRKNVLVRLLIGAFEELLTCGPDSITCDSSDHTASSLTLPVQIVSAPTRRLF